MQKEEEKRGRGEGLEEGLQVEKEEKAKEAKRRGRYIKRGKTKQKGREI